MEEKTMDNVEVTTEVSGADEVTTDITITDLPPKPSKGFVALVAGGIAALAVGAAVAYQKHKKKKSEAAVEEEEIDDEDDWDDEDLDAADTKVEVEESEVVDEE